MRRYCAHDEYHPNHFGDDSLVDPDPIPSDVYKKPIVFSPPGDSLNTTKLRRPVLFLPAAFMFMTSVLRVRRPAATCTPLQIQNNIDSISRFKGRCRGRTQDRSKPGVCCSYSHGPCSSSCTAAGLLSSNRPRPHETSCASHHLGCSSSDEQCIRCGYCQPSGGKLRSSEPDLCYPSCSTGQR